MPAPRDPLILMSIALEAAADPTTSAADRAILQDYLGDAGISAVIETLRRREQTDERLLQILQVIEPQVHARRAEKMLLALASVMPPRMSLRQTLAFVMIARGTLQKGPLTIANVQEQAGLDAQRNPVIGKSITNTKASLADLIHASSSNDSREKPMRLKRKGDELIKAAIEKLRGLVY